MWDSTSAKGLRTAQDSVTQKGCGHGKHTKAGSPQRYFCSIVGLSFSLSTLGKGRGKKVVCRAGRRWDLLRAQTSPRNSLAISKERPPFL